MTTDNISNNKRIAKNTLFLYFRMIVIMLVNLYTVREFLHILGVVDYGIYNVVGSVVLMFSFINGTLATSSQRYFSVKIAENNREELHEYFCLNITIFLTIALVVIVLAEIFGLWYINYLWPSLPGERIVAANIVFQFTLLTFLLNMFTIPYNASIIAHERMNVFAYISIVEAGMKLLIVFLLQIIQLDKLVTFGMLLMFSSAVVTASYVTYCRNHFEETKFQLLWDKKKALDLFGFTSWHFIGTMSTVVRSQGINILLSWFFTPAVNAARAIAFQVSNAANQLTANFFTAVKPQIYKLYAQGKKEEFEKLLLRSSSLSFVLLSIIVFPILANTGYILSLWLKAVPDYAVVFTQLVLINALIDSTNGPTIAAALATGKIKRYELVVAGMIFLNLPISYMALRLGAEPTATMIISSLISVILVFTRVWLLKSMIGVNIVSFCKLYLRLVLVSLLMLVVIWLIGYNKANCILLLVIISVALIIVQIILSYFITLSSEDRRTIIGLLLKRIKK